MLQGGQKSIGQIRYVLTLCICLFVGYHRKIKCGNAFHLLVVILAGLIEELNKVELTNNFISNNDGLKYLIRQFST